MREIFNYLRTRYLSEKAQGMVEYAMVLAFVVIVVAAISTTDNGLKTAINDAFTNVSKKISANS